MPRGRDASRRDGPDLVTQLDPNSLIEAPPHGNSPRHGQILYQDDGPSDTPGVVAIRQATRPWARTTTTHAIAPRATNTLDHGGSSSSLPSPSSRSIVSSTPTFTPTPSPPGLAPGRRWQRNHRSALAIPSTPAGQFLRESRAALQDRQVKTGIVCGPPAHALAPHRMGTRSTASRHRQRWPRGPNAHQIPPPESDDAPELASRRWRCPVR